jgi:RimJ/RimL family protein N-acetyltransferase
MARPRLGPTLTRVRIRGRAGLLLPPPQGTHPTLLYLPPGGEDLEIGWQLAPEVWGQGLASEAGHLVAHWALGHPGVDEVFAVVRPTNARAAATAKRIGMEWVGETDKYYDLQLNVYRLRSADLDRPLPGQTQVPHPG